MAYIRLTKPGYLTFTGPLLGVMFTNGLSANTSIAKIDRIAAAIGGNLVQADGTTVISEAGYLAREAAAGRSKPDRVIPRAEAVIAEGAAQRIRDVPGTAYTLTINDAGQTLNFTGAAVITVPASLPANFSCKLRQGGASQITVSTSGVTIEEMDSRYKSEKRYAVLELSRMPSGNFHLAGRTAA